jgi:hypothetical protein
VDLVSRLTVQATSLQLPRGITNHRVQVLRYSDGSHTRTIGCQGSKKEQLNHLFDVWSTAEGALS